MLDRKIKEEIEFYIHQSKGGYGLADEHIHRAFELLEVLYEETKNRPTLIYKKDSLTAITMGKLSDKFDLIEYHGDKPPQVIR